MAQPRGSDQCSIPNAQFSAEVDVGLRVVRSVRIRIEHWELNIGQIPIGHSAKLFLREPLASCRTKPYDAAITTNTWRLVGGRRSHSRIPLPGQTAHRASRTLRSVRASAAEVVDASGQGPRQ